MATESFTSRFLVDKKSADSVARILNESKPTLLNCQRNYRRVTQKEILERYLRGKTK